MPRPEAGMASLFNVSLRSSEPTDQEISEALLAQGFPHSVNTKRDAWNGFTVRMKILISFNSLKTQQLCDIFGGESGIRSRADSKGS
jgi:hypothetical protein